jgi:hypothetical protein
MKRLLSAALALSLFGGTAAFADPYDHGDRGYNGYGYNYHDRDYRSYHRHGDNGAAVVAGLGILTLAVVLASQHHHDHDGWYNRDRGYDGDGYYRDGYGRDGYGGGY